MALGLSLSLIRRTSLPPRANEDITHAGCIRVSTTPGRSRASSAPPATATPALDRILPLLYDDLRRLARRQLGRASARWCQPTELVHEAYLKISVGGAAAA